MRNPWPPKSRRAGWRTLAPILLAVAAAWTLTGRPAIAAGAAKPAPAKPVAVAPRATTAPSTLAPADQIPDYGGRDVLGTSSAPGGADAPASPLSQAWRAFQALIVVLAVTVGFVFFIKKYGLVKAGSVSPSTTPRAGLPGMLMTGWQNFLQAGNRPPAAVDTSAALNVLSSTTLPGPAPASVHLVEVAGRRYFVGATAGGMTLLADWESEPAAEADEPVIPAEDEQFENYLNRMGMTAQTPPEVVGERVSQTTDRLQALLARNQEGTE